MTALARIPPIGALSRRLRVEAPVEIPDGQGGVTRSFAGIDILFADVSIEALSGGVAADRATGRSRIRVTARAPNAMDIGRRLVDGDRTYLIVSLVRLDAGGAFSVAEAEEIDP